VVAAAAEVEGGGHGVVGVLTFDRTSDSPAGVFPERRAHRETLRHHLLDAARAAGLTCLRGWV
jgi:hypothetical protein